MCAALLYSTCNLCPRLILKVLSEEVRKTNPFVATTGELAQLDFDCTLQLLGTLHEVFDAHPPTTNANVGNSNDTAFCTAKTVAFQMVKTVGLEKLTEVIDSRAQAGIAVSATLSGDSYIVRLLQRRFCC